MPAQIMIVDDDEQIRSWLTTLLQRDGYHVIVAQNGREALELVARAHPDLILLDVSMPVLNGYEVCRQLKDNPQTALIPVTMLTALDLPDDRLQGIAAGADDFLTKPCDIATLRARIQTQLRIKRLTDQLEHTEQVIFAMARWVEFKDPYTEGHIRRIADYSQQLAEALGLPAEQICMVRYAGILHDIGKIGVSEAILRKPGPLSPEERIQIQRHAEFGAQIIAPLRFAADVAPMIRAHHEHWDGQGYPDQLVGEQIPLGARIIAAVDAYDAMTTDRPYRRALDFDEVLRRLQAGSGHDWDPMVIEALVELIRSGRLNSLREQEYAAGSD